MSVNTQMQIALVLTTFPEAEPAKQAAHYLVQAQLAACGTVLPTATSIYMWEGTIEENSECLLLLKTTLNRLNDLQVELLKIHPYEVPEIIAFVADFCHPAYEKWVRLAVGC